MQREARSLIKPRRMGSGEGQRTQSSIRETTGKASTTKRDVETQPVCVADGSLPFKTQK